MASYDFALNERVRTLLRLEDLLKKITHYSQNNDAYAHHATLLALFQLLDVTDRSDIKADLLQELDRQALWLKHLQSNLAFQPSELNEEALNTLLLDLKQSGDTLRAQTFRIGQCIRDNDWLLSLKQRMIMPCGLCEFDLPSYRYWLNLSAQTRADDIKQWLAPLLPVDCAVKALLKILRGNGKTTEVLAQNGSFQQMLMGAKPAQLLIISIADDAQYCPEVSANKYAISVRFNSFHTAQKPQLIQQDIPFSLTLCNL